MNRTRKLPCTFYQQNRCKNGSACTFSHDTLPLESYTPSSSSTQRRQCTFYLQNRCKNGSACVFSHDAPPAVPTKLMRTSWRPPGNAEAPPTYVEPVTTQQASGDVFIPCKFFQSGSCRSGIGCKFVHVALGTTPPLGERDLNVNQMLPKANPNKDDGAREETRVMGETLSVKFGDGIEILGVTSAAATPIVTVYNLPPDVSLLAVREFIAPHLAQHGIDEPAIRLIPIEDGTYATVKLGDVTAAEKIAECLDGQTLEGHQVSAKLYRSKGLSSISQSAARVLCTWFAPSKIAYISLQGKRSDKISRIAAAANGRWVKGRKISCREHKASITIGGMALAAAKEDFERVFHVPSSAIAFDEPIGTIPGDEVVARVLSLFDDKSIDGHEVVSLPNAQKVKLVVRFKSEAAALKAVADHHRKNRDFLNGSPLFVQRVITATFKVLPDIHRAIHTELVQLSKDQPPSVKVKVFKSPHTLVTIRITGEDWTSVRHAQNSIGKLVRGDLCTGYDGTPVWDAFFLSSEGQEVISKTKKDCNAFIHIDRRKSTISLFGTAEARREATDVLSSLTRSRKDTVQHAISLTLAEWRNLMRGQLQILQEQFGPGNIGINVGSRTLVFRGSAANLDVARSLLSENNGADAAASHTNTSPGDSGEDCQVCWTPAEEEIRLSCGHAYCKGCLTNYLTSKLDLETRSFPICCIACSVPIQLSDIKGIVTPDQLDSLLSAAFASHIQKNRDQYSYCPTANCNTVYTPTTTGELFSCVACLQTICTTCQIPSHDGMSCTEYRLKTHEDKDADRLFDEWKKKNDVKKCPKCRTEIEKKSGCNHMTCAACKAHICWVCMDVFPEAEDVYPHMEREHGGFGL